MPLLKGCFYIVIREDIDNFKTDEISESRQSFGRFGRGIFVSGAMLVLTIQWSFPVPDGLSASAESCIGDSSAGAPDPGKYSFLGCRHENLCRQSRRNRSHFSVQRDQYFNKRRGYR